jgi:ligand-binding sensor domain-containing protein
VAPDGSDGINVLAGTFDGLWISTNNGTSWREISNGLINTTIISLASMPNTTGPPTLFAGTYGSGVYQSTNNGASWTETNSGLADGLVIALAVQDDNIYAGTTSGVFRSTDRGGNWLPMNGGLTASIVFDFAVAGQQMFAGTEAGVFHSSNSGASWSNVSTGLDYTNVRSLDLSPDGMNLLAGTSGGGVWKRPLSEVLVSAPIVSENIPSRFFLSQNYPNPFNPTTVIGYDVAATEHVTLRVYNLLGQQVVELVNGVHSPGSYTVTLDASKLPSGVYFDRLETSSFAQTRRLVLLR